MYLILYFVWRVRVVVVFHTVRMKGTLCEVHFLGGLALNPLILQVMTSCNYLQTCTTNNVNNVFHLNKK